MLFGRNEGTVVAKLRLVLGGTKLRGREQATAELRWASKSIVDGLRASEGLLVSPMMTRSSSKRLSLQAMSFVPISSPFTCKARSRKPVSCGLVPSGVVGKAGLEFIGSAGVIAAGKVFKGDPVFVAASIFATTLLTKANVVPAVTVAYLFSDLAAVSRIEAFLRLIAQGLAALLVSSYGLAPLLPVLPGTKKLVLSCVIAVTVSFFHLRSRKYGQKLASVALALTSLTSLYPNSAAVLSSLLQYGEHPLPWPTLLLPMIAGALCGLAYRLRRASFIANMMEKTRGYQKKLQDYGLAGLVAYGILNTLYYSVVFGYVMLQVTKPLRFALSLAIAPFVKSTMTRWGWLAETNGQMPAGNAETSELRQDDASDGLTSP